MTIVERIIADHAGVERVAPGDMLSVAVDRIYLQDGNSPTIGRLFADHGFTSVFDAERIGVFFDHSVIAPNVEIADRLKEARHFSDDFGLVRFRAGAGISHIVALDSGWFAPGTIVLGSDSHTCTGGATQCLALGMGASDIAAAMVTGTTWLRVPETLWLDVIGEPGAAAGPKDVILFALAELDRTRFLYASVEWAGGWPERLSLDGAATVANMAVDMGAKCTFLPPGAERPRTMTPIRPPGADDPRRIALDISGLPPMIATPHSPSNGVPIDECRGKRIDTVFVGSCANSRLDDIAEVARVLARAPVHERVQCLVAPGSQRILLEASRLGYVETLTRAGAVLLPPGCGACLGTQGGVPASGDRVLATMNRNFLGRMGNARAEIYLASPLVAAHTAVRGEIPAERDLA